MPGDDPMAQAEPANTTNPSGVTLTRKGERYVFEHLKVPESPEEYFRALATLRKAARDEIERLIDFLDRAAGDPDLEPTGDEDEPTLGWPAGGPRVAGSTMDGEAEPSLGWTGIINQASRNRLGEGEDYEKDDADDEDSDPGEESDEGELEPDAEPNGDEMDGNLAGTTTTEEEAAYSPSLQYITRLRKRRGQSVPARHGPLAP